MNELQQTNALTPDSIQSHIHEIRGQKVMLDHDLATLYQVETKRLKEQVKRNLSRFPTDAMFVLTKEEHDSLRSQIATSNKRGGTRYLPFAFTELGVAMLSSILTSDVAIQVNLNIMRAFVMMRNMLQAHTEMENIRLELSSQRQYIEEILRDQNDTNINVQEQLDAISLSLAELQSDIKHHPLSRITVKGFNQ